MRKSEEEKEKKIDAKKTERNNERNFAQALTWQNNKPSTFIDIASAVERKDVSRGMCTCYRNERENENAAICLPINNFLLT